MTNSSSSTPQTTNPPAQQPARLMSICPSCGASFERRGRNGSCEDCTPKRDSRRKDYGRGTPTERGYDAAWRRLSARARRLSPFCEDCGTTDDLTADHTVIAWQRKAEGKPIRLQDIAVVCRTCNAERGAARGDGATDEWRGNNSLRGLI